MKVMQAVIKFKGKLTPLVFTDVKYIVLHHLKADTASVATIHQWHLDNGWLGFGYNEYIRKDGTVYIGRGDNKGAHAGTVNGISYGIALEGDYEITQDMPMEQFDSLIKRIKFHQTRFPRNLSVEPHRRFMNTSCPGKHFPMHEIKEALKGAYEGCEAREESLEKITYEKLLLEDKILAMQEEHAKEVKHLDSIIAKVREQYKEMRRFYQEQVAENKKLKG